MKTQRLAKIGLPEIVKLFVRLNLCLHNEEIKFTCRKLRRKGHIYSALFYSGSVFIRKSRSDEEFIEIHHLHQLPCLFPDFKFTFQRDKQG